MSTRARKERKAAGIPLVKVPKVGTSVEDRFENKRRPIRPLGSLVAKRFGRTSKVVARLKAYGVEAELETKP